MATTSPVNYFAQQNPDFALQQLQTQRQQKIADMLTEEGAAPINYDHAGKISWTQGLAKMLQTYGGIKMSKDAIKSQAGLNSQSARMVMDGMQDQPVSSGEMQQAQARNTFDAGQAASQVAASNGAPSGPTLSTAALANGLSDQMPPPQTTRHSALNPAGWNPQFAASSYMSDQPAYFKAQSEQIAPTTEQKNTRDEMIGKMVRNNLESQNQTPLQKLISQRSQLPGDSPLNKTLDDAISKENYIAPIDAKQGTPLLDPRTYEPKFFAPKTGDGIGLDFSKPLAPTSYALPGYAAANAAIQGAQANATAGESIGMVKDGNPNSPTFGADVPTRMGAAASAGQAQLGLSKGPSGYANGGTAATAAEGQIAIIKSEMARPGNSPADMAGMQREISRIQSASPQVAQQPQQTAPRLGVDPTVQTARSNQQTSMAEKWKPLNDAASNAQTINSRLDTIKDLSTRASTGQMADKIQFANSLLSLAGSERANDANTAKVLIDKNANQIVAQLGQGGLGTDAARAILQSAYPNSHMPREAIAEAADNLKAANQMMVAKSKVLQPHYQQNDPAGYQQKESDFNSAADPSIFQWKALSSNPAAQKAFAAKLLQKDPQAPAKIHALEQLGAFK